MNKPLYVTSTTHVMALWAYAILAASGVAWLFAFPSQESIRALLRWPAAVTLWAIIWAASGLTGLIAATAAGRVKAPNAAEKIRWWLFVEAGADLGAALSVGTWVWAVIDFRGWNGALATIIFASGYLGGCIHRIRQIWRERPLLAAAALHPDTAEVLAEAPTEDD